MTDPIPFTYGEFYDFPRMIRFQFQGKWFFLRLSFDDEQDDYAPTYTVYLLPHTSNAEIEADPLYWMELQGATNLGRIEIGQLGLDSTRRKTIEAQSFAGWLANLPSPGGATDGSQG